MIKSLTTLIPGSVWDIRIRFSLAKVPLVAILVTLLSFSCSPSSKKEIGNENNSPADSASPEFRINSLTSQISSDPTNYILRKERSLLFYKTGNTQKAIEDIDSALVSNKTGPELWHLRGYYQYHLKNDDQSLLDFKESARLGSENPETYFQIGQIYFLKGDLTEADKWYETAIQKDSLDPQYEFARGILYQQKKDIKTALKFFNRSLEKNPGFIRSLASLHDIYFNDFKDYKKAQEFNDRILKADSLHPVGHFNEGNQFLDLAMGVFDTTKTKEFEALIQLAISEYSTAIFSNPAYTQAYYNRGYCFFQLDEFDPAIADFEKTISLDPRNEKAHFMLGSIQEHFDDIEGARIHYQKALDIQPKFKEAAEAVNDLKKIGK